MFSALTKLVAASQRPIEPEMANPSEIDSNDVPAEEAAGLDGFEEDDEFEEFENDKRNAEEDEKLRLQQWDDDWDDDDVNDDFSQYLREELRAPPSAEPSAFPDPPFVVD